MMRIAKLAVALAVTVATLVGLMPGTATAIDEDCATRGGMVFAQSSGSGKMSVVQVWCADGTSWYLD